MERNLYDRNNLGISRRPHFHTEAQDSMLPRSATNDLRRSEVSKRAENSRAYPVPPRRTAVPYPDYYDGKAFNPRPSNDFENDIVRGLLLEWTPAGNGSDDVAKGDETAHRVYRNSSTEDPVAKPATQTNRKERSEAAEHEDQMGTNNYMNGFETDEDKKSNSVITVDTL
jgi:hypothetical protein